MSKNKEGIVVKDVLIHQFQQEGQKIIELENLEENIMEYFVPWKHQMVKTLE